MVRLFGVDIGGTKCAVLYGVECEGELEIIDKMRFDTTRVEETISQILATLRTMMSKHELSRENVGAVGIICGGPLDSRAGVIMSPPNLPGWDDIPIVRLVEECVGVPAALQNDANACALAEYKYGAGRGSRNMVFMTFGTGLGAGIIIDGRLYTGANDNAGELGHIRLAPDGPIGYGKHGSFEGFCSGGGIRQLARQAVTEAYDRGETVPWCRREDIPLLNARIVAEAANEGDALARSIYECSAEYLGMGLSIVVDILNPERIVIGSIYARNEDMMRPVMEALMQREALSEANRVCCVVPAALGEQVGDYAALSVASNSLILH